MCLNVGCIPLKALLRNAELAHIFTKDAKTYGISGDTRFDYSTAYDRSRAIAEGRSRHPLPDEEKQHHRVRRPGHIHRPTHAERATSTGTETVTFDHAVIASGSVARRPGAVPQCRDVRREILSRDLPKSALIIGAGAIGIEFAYVLHNYGVDARWCSTWIVRYPPRTLTCPRRSPVPTANSASPSKSGRRKSVVNTGGRAEVTSGPRLGSTDTVTVDR